MQFLIRISLYAIAYMPLWLLYGISNFLFLIVFYVVKYRKKMVIKNLKMCFPEKNDKEINKICRDYYLFFTDLIVETLKMLTISAKEMKRRIYFKDLALVEKFEKENKSFFIMMGHVGCWEWGSASFQLHTNYQTLVIYRPLRNIFFDDFIKKLRTRFGQEATSMRNTVRNLIRLKDTLHATAFIADQRPENNKDAVWTEFFGTKIDFLQGTEVLAQKFGYPVVFAEITRPKRGYYEINFEMISENPKNSPKGEITQDFAKKLENQIRKNPHLWLWSHDRWRNCNHLTCPPAPEGGASPKESFI